MHDPLRARKLRRRLDTSRLYLLLDGRGDEAEFAGLARALVAAGVSVVQLRDKGLTDRQLLGRARRLREITRRTATLFVVNDRPDVALVSEADGVHVGQDELPVAECRAVLGPTPLVGVSTHDLDQVRAAISAGADYIGCGPTYPSATKGFTSFPGTAFLRQVARQCPIPAFAIGGIDAERLPEVLAAGFSRVAVSGAVLDAPDPAANARLLLQRLAEQRS